MAQGSGVRGWQAPPASASVTLETVQDLLGSSSYVSPNSTLTIAYDDPGNRFTFDLNLAHSNIWAAQQEFDGDGGNSPVTGGNVNITATGGATGTGLIVYSNNAGPTGRLVHIWQDNPAATQNAFRVVNDGTGIGVQMLQTNVAGNILLDLDSASTSTTAVGIEGDVTAQSLVKLTHTHDTAGSDAAAAILRLNWEDANGSGTAVQGIFMATEPGGPATTGDLIKIWNGPSNLGPTTALLRLTAGGDLYLKNNTIFGGPVVTESLSLAPNDQALGTGQLIFDLSRSRYTTAANILTNWLLPPSATGAWTVANTVTAIGSGQTIDFAAGGGFRALVTSGTINITAAPNGVPFLVFNMGTTITMADNTAVRLQTPQIYASKPVMTPPDTVRVPNAGGSSAGGVEFLANAFFNPGLFVSIPDASINIGTSTFTLNAHGMAANRRVVFGGTPPTPLVAGTVYYAVTITANTFQVSATSGGAAIALGALVGVNATTMQRGNIDIGTTEATGVWNNFKAQNAVQAGWRIPSLYGLHVYAQTGSGGIVDMHAAVQIEDLDTAAGQTGINPYLSLRSLGAAVQMRHAGPAVFGTSGAPTNATGIALEVQSTTQAFLVPRMTGAQMNAIVGPVDGMIVYVNDNATVPGPNFYSRKGGAWVAGV